MNIYEYLANTFPGARIPHLGKGVYLPTPNLFPRKSEILAAGPCCKTISILREESPDAAICVLVTLFRALPMLSLLLVLNSP